MTAAAKPPLRFRDQAIAFTNGAVGQNIEIPSASPVNYHQVISAPSEMPRLAVDGKLFLPPATKRTAKGKLPLVPSIMIGGSGANGQSSGGGLVEMMLAMMVAEKTGGLPKPASDALPPLFKG